MTITTVPDDAMVKPESMASEVVITKEMEKEEKQLMEEGERQENEMIEKVCCLFIWFLENCFFKTASDLLRFIIFWLIFN